MSIELIPGEEWRKVQDLEDRNNLPPDEEFVAAARRNIEKIRKSDLTLKFVDRNGQPLRGLHVDLQQTKHAFIFGCSSGPTFEAIEKNPAEAARAHNVVRLFNGTHAKCYWDEKWHQPIEKHQGRREMKQFLAELDWGCANGMAVRGHPLVWTVDKAIPQWLRKYPYGKQLEFLEHHVRALVASTDKRIRTWDMVNEMLWEPVLKNLAYRDWPHIEPIDEIADFIAPTIRWAREEDPTACYCLNEYGLEFTYTKMKNVTAPMQRQRFVELVDALRQRGAAPDAIGTQAHIGKWFPMALVVRTFDDLAKAGVALHVSEFWAHHRDHPNPDGLSPDQLERDQATYVANYYTVAFGTPGVEQISHWGDDSFFKGNGWRTTHAYDAIYDLVKRQWWTRTRLTTDDAGVAKVRAFQGDYLYRIKTANGDTLTRTLRVEPNAATVLTLTI